MTQFVLLFTACLFLPSVSAETGQRVPEIIADNAIISSPQTTLASLIRLTDVYHELVSETGITTENRERLKNINQQFEKLFDLREVPPKFRRNVAAETAVYLREAMARFPVPRMEDVPDEDRMVSNIKDGKMPLYRLPGTPVVISKTGAGMYEGRYQFSSATGSEARNWYEVARQFPYMAGQDYIDGLYNEYFLTPGPMIPYELVRALPEWMQHLYLAQAVWKWLLLVASLLVLVGLLMLLYMLVNRISTGRSRIQRNLILLLWPIGVIYLTLGARHFLERQVFLTGEVLQGVLFGAKLVILTAVVFLIMRVGGVLTEAILTFRKFNTRQIDQQLARLGIRMLTTLIAVIIVMEGMQQIGFSLATLVAGAGVTGLAIALAAQDTLKNVFGGLLLAMDRPFEVGQLVKMRGYEGFIQQVGLRSIRVRTRRGHEIIIPNDEAARIEVENIGRRPYIRRDLNITITYDTPPEKIARAVEILRAILAVPEASADETATPGGAGDTPHPNEAVNQPDYPPRVYFNALNADSLNLLVVYWFHPPDHWLSVEFAHRVNMQIMERFNAEGIDFAFPSQTMYLAGDSKRPLVLDQQPSSAATATPPGAGVSSQAGVAARPVPSSAGKPINAIIEDGLLHGKDGGEADDNGESTS
ncbi:MAG: mechanosensitive ion channel family protein [Pseudomonadota bacterium]|nr:mechanosensitive ion channel family protein [Pseudomonadota bacterium]